MLNKLSTELLLRGEENHPSACKPHIIEDVDIGECLHAYGVNITDTRDRKTRQEKQHCHEPIDVLDNPKKYLKYFYINIKNP